MSLFRVLQSDSECESEPESKSTDDTYVVSIRYSNPTPSVDQVIPKRKYQIELQMRGNHVMYDMYATTISHKEQGEWHILKHYQTIHPVIIRDGHLVLTCDDKEHAYPLTSGMVHSVKEWETNLFDIDGLTEQLSWYQRDYLISYR